MKWALLILAAVLISLGTMANANSKIMSDAMRIEKTKPKDEQIKYSCATCHAGSAPSKIHPYNRKELTEEGRRWLPADQGCEIQ